MSEKIVNIIQSQDIEADVELWQEERIHKELQRLLADPRISETAKEALKNHELIARFSELKGGSNVG